MIYFSFSLSIVQARVNVAFCASRLVHDDHIAYILIVKIMILKCEFKSCIFLTFIALSMLVY